MTRLSDESGFTVAEVLTALTIGLVVTMATLGLVEFVMKRTGEVERRVDATQRARLAMDTMTRQLRSQVCLSSTVPPIEDGTPNEVTFYTDLTDSAPGKLPERHVLKYDPAAKTITHDSYLGSGTAPSITYDLSSPRKRTLLTNVLPDGAEPLFRYYRFDGATPPQPKQELTTPLKANGNEKLVARLAIRFKTLPTRPVANDRTGISLHDDVYVRAADPENPAPIPTCT
ncbi:MAG: PilW family protein [Nocardioidaceae bacterium]